MHLINEFSCTDFIYEPSQGAHLLHRTQGPCAGVGHAGNKCLGDSSSSCWGVSPRDGSLGVILTWDRFPTQVQLCLTLHPVKAAAWV